MRLFKSLTSKVILLYIALAIMNTAFLITIVFENQVDLITDVTKLEAEKVISTLTSSLKKFSSETDQGQIFKNEGDKSAQLAGIIDPFVKNYSIFDEAGHIRYKSESSLPLPETYLQDAARAVANRDFTGKSHYLTIDEKDYRIYFYIPLDVYGSGKSTLFISYDIMDINKRLKNLYAQAVLIIAVVSIFHLLFAVLLFRIIIHPMQVLNMKSKEIAHGNLAARVNINRNDEIGDLSQSFDSMAESIEDQVETLNRQMEIITESKKKIEELATTDDLTGLYNRRFFFARVEEEVQRAKRHNSSLGFVMIDIDHFKQVNDTYGHQTGDIVLKHVANTIKNACRNIDIIGRYGGEEISVLAPDCPPENIHDFAERIRAIVENSVIDTPDGQVHITISAGATSFDDLLLKSVNNPSSMLVYFSDTSLYRAKHNGRNAVVVG